MIWTRKWSKLDGGAPSSRELSALDFTDTRRSAGLSVAATKGPCVCICTVGTDCGGRIKGGMGGTEKEKYGRSKIQATSFPPFGAAMAAHYLQQRRDSGMQGRFSRARGGQRHRKVIALCDGGGRHGLEQGHSPSLSSSLGCYLRVDCEQNVTSD